MALPSTGVITMAQVRTELGRTGVIRLNDATVRTLAGRASGLISMSHLRGKGAVTHRLTRAYWQTSDKVITADYYGFRSGGGGSISPTTLNGASISQFAVVVLFAGTSSVVATLTIRVAGNRAKNFFGSVAVQGLGTFTSSSATHTQDSNVTTWAWSTAWPNSNWSGSGTVDVKFT